MRVRVPMRKALDELLGRYDALVTPTRTAVAPPIGYDFDKPPQPPPSPAPDSPAPPSTIPAGNLAGLPALCVPNGFGQHGLPTSLQFLGRAFSEATLIDLGDRYQNATGWHLKRPPMDKLADGTVESTSRAQRGVRRAGAAGPLPALGLGWTRTKSWRGSSERGPGAPSLGWPVTA